MSKISDKLKRLHQSRINAIDQKQHNDGVFFADKHNPSSSTPPRCDLDDRRQTQTNSKKFNAILRHQTLKEKSGSARSKESRSLGSYQLKAASDYDSPTQLGERLKDLRIQAQALIEAGRRESALPLLFELLAYSPDHVFALSKLVDHFSDAKEMREVFAKRLKKVAHY